MTNERFEFFKEPHYTKSGKEKKTMLISVNTPYSTGDGKYHVNWGTTPVSFSKTIRRFSKKSSAVKFAKGLIKKYSTRYSIDYKYLAD